MDLRWQYESRAGREPADPQAPTEALQLLVAEPEALEAWVQCRLTHNVKGPARGGAVVTGR